MTMLVGVNQLPPALVPLSQQCNPRQSQFFTAKRKSKGSPGLDDEFVYRDPWGNPYTVTLDLDGDHVSTDPTYGTVNASVAVWSAGPDGRAGANPNDPENKDNVLSWK